MALFKKKTFASILIAARHLPMNQQCPTIFGRNVPDVNGPYIQKKWAQKKSVLIAAIISVSVPGKESH